MTSLKTSAPTAPTETEGQNDEPRYCGECTFNREVHDKMIREGFLSKHDFIPVFSKPFKNGGYPD